MRRSRFAAAFTMVALAMPVLAAGVLGASGDSVTGFGRLTLADASASVSVSARSDSSGGGASGIIRIDRTGAHTFSGIVDVDCLLVDGARATVAGFLRSPVPNPNEPGTFYQRVIVAIEDLGSGGGSADVWNTFVMWGEPGSISATCIPFSGGGPSDVGNFTVTDS